MLDHPTAPATGLELERAWAARLGQEKFDQLRSILKELIAALDDRSPNG